MKVEYEATFPDISKDEIRRILRNVNAVLLKSEFLQRRVVFNLPQGHEIAGGWLRVRDESDRITMTLKVVTGDIIENQKEICLEVDDFDQAELLLLAIGCRKKAYQESKREIWKLGDVEIMIDEWPFLEPFVEVEGNSELAVQAACERLDLNYTEALFCSVDTLYSRKYGVDKDFINNRVPELTFAGRSPFL